MHELDDDGAFADAGCDALYGAVADIADNKDARDVGFQQDRVAVKRPGSGSLAIAKEVRAREDKAALVAFDEVAEPFGAWLRTDENEEAGSGKLLADASSFAKDSDP